MKLILIQIERALKTKLISIVDIYIVLQNNIGLQLIPIMFNKRTSASHFAIKRYDI